MRRVALVGLALLPLAFVTGVLANSIQAVQPGPIKLPAVQLIAQDACSGKPIAGLTATFVPTSGQTGPGPSGQVGLTHAWPAKDFQAGTYDLDLSAPGYEPIPVPNLNPTGLSAVAGLVSGQLVAVTMVPVTYPPNPCLDLPPAQVPALAGSVINGVTSIPITDPGPIELISPTGLGPVPHQNPGADSFSFGQGTVSPGTDDLSVAANGYEPLGPVQVTVNPGTQNLPDGDSFVIGDTVVAMLQPAPAGG